MPPRNCTRLEEGTIYINGCETKGIESFEWSYDENLARDYVKNNMRWKTDDGLTFTVTCKINRTIYFKLTGLWDWALTYCPSRKVKHLMKFGKNDRVKLKNFYRAMRLIGKEI